MSLLSQRPRGERCVRVCTDRNQSSHRSGCPLAGAILPFCHAQAQDGCRSARPGILQASRPHFRAACWARPQLAPPRLHGNRGAHARGLGAAAVLPFWPSTCTLTEQGEQEPRCQHLYAADPRHNCCSPSTMGPSFPSSGAPMSFLLLIRNWLGARSYRHQPIRQARVAACVLWLAPNLFGHPFLRAWPFLRTRPRSSNVTPHSLSAGAACSSAKLRSLEKLGFTSLIACHLLEQVISKVNSWQMLEP